MSARRRLFPVFSPTAGRVGKVNDLGTVTIETEEGRSVVYFHLYTVDVREGDRVEAGQQIGMGL